MDTLEAPTIYKSRSRARDTLPDTIKDTMIPQKDSTANARPGNGIDTAIGHNAHLHYVRKKCERIAAALLLVSDTVRPEDPVRLHLRAKGLALVEVAYGTEASWDFALDRLLDEVCALLETSAIGRAISDMNARVLVRECSELRVFLRKSTESRARESRPVSESLFEVPTPALSVERGVVETFDALRVADGVEQESTQKNTLGHDKERSNSGKQGVKTSSPRARQDQGRRSRILALIKEKGRVSMKDVVEVVTGYSEKTLQRELVGMVSEGILEKEGERRWSTYMLAPERAL